MRILSPLVIVVFALAGPVVRSAPDAVYPGNPAVSAHARFVSDAGLARFDGQRLRWRALDGVHTFEPVPAGARVLVGSSEGLYAVDVASGAIRWTLRSAVPVFSPVVHGAVAYAGSRDGTLRAVDVRTGRVRWTRRVEGWVYSPALAAGVLVAGGSSHFLRGFDAADGEPRWCIPLGQELVYRPVGAPDGSVLVTTFAGETLSVWPRDGQVRWQVRDPSPGFLPAVAGGTVVTGGFDAVLRARSLADGRLRWAVRLTARPAHPPRIQGDFVVVADEGGSVSVLSEQTGGVVRHVRSPAAAIAAPLLHEDRLVVFVSGAGPPASSAGRSTSPSQGAYDHETPQQVQYFRFRGHPGRVHNCCHQSDAPVR